MNRRQAEGSEAWHRLKNWDRGQKASERLAAHILQAEGYKSIDPSHPLGGSDGLKDIICCKNNQKWIGASYFSKNEQKFKKIEDKFIDDIKGVETNSANGFAFVTNQHITVGDREKLKNINKSIEVDIFHLERITTLLNFPECYGIRLEFLDIEMDKEEQLSFIALRDKKIEELSANLDEIISHINKSETLRKEFEKVKNIDTPLEMYEKISKKFKYEEGPGWYVHRVTGDVFCYHCMQQGEIEQLMKYQGYPASWVCPKCNNCYDSIMRMIKRFMGRGGY